jgi:hypothetical protein
MTCRWKGRANLRGYCCTCGHWTRAGCLLDMRLSTRRDYHYHTPAEFPKGAAA